MCDNAELNCPVGREITEQTSPVTQTGRPAAPGHAEARGPEHHLLAAASQQPGAAI